MLLRKSALIMGTAALALGLISGCNYKSVHEKSANDYGSRQANDPKMTGIRSYSSEVTDPRTHDNRYFEYSSKLSYKVSNLPGVNAAIVMLTDKNAYIGIMTDSTATGTRSHGGKNVREQDNTGTTEGVYNIDTGSSNWDLTKAVTPYNSYYSHKDISDLSTEFRQTIAQTVRKSAPNVGGVHISANQEYMNQLLRFAQASWAGKPLKPLTGDFNKLVKYVFSLSNEVPTPLNLQTDVNKPVQPSDASPIIRK